MPITPPKINIGPDGDIAWLQTGLRWGVNDAGAFQSFSRRGTREVIEDLAASFNVEGWTYEITREAAGLARIDAHAGWSLGTSYTSEDPENIWELEGNEVEKNLLECDFPNSSAFTGTGIITKANKAVIADALLRPQDFASTDPVFSGTADQKTAAQSLYLLMKNGVSAFPVEASVITHTQIVSNRYTVKASYTNCNRIISTSNMTAVEGVPSDLLYDVPAEPTPTQYIETTGDLAYGWRKVRPTVTRLARFKYRILQKYQFGLWAVKLYGSVI